jgi:hypothetical protein
MELLVQDYLDGYLLPSQQQDLEEHLAGCPACREELVRLQRLEERLEWSPPVEVPSDLAVRVAARLPEGRYMPGWLVGAIRGAAVGLSLLSLVVLVVLIISQPGGGGRGRQVELTFYAPNATSVMVAGDFNDWNPQRHAMRRTGDGSWNLTLNLPPGLYQYNFLIDHRYWAERPGEGALVSDGFGGRNALLFIEG